MIAYSPQSLAVMITLLGAAAALVAGLVPFFHVGYIVDAVALAAVATPFVAYAMLINTLRGPWLIGAGLVLLAVTLAVVVDERVLGFDGYHSGTIFWVPLLAAAIVLPVSLLFGRRDPQG